jgi:hypothetical protein
MKKSEIWLIELGMLSCIILAAVLLPGRTSLRGFLTVSSEFLLIGNYLVVKAVEDSQAQEDAAVQHRWKWSRFLGVFVIIEVPLVLLELFHLGK